MTFQSVIDLGGEFEDPINSETKTTTVEPKQEKVWTEKEIASLSMDEFDKYESEISEAMQQGRIIRD